MLGDTPKPPPEGEPSGRPLSTVMVSQSNQSGLLVPPFDRLSPNSRPLVLSLKCVFYYRVQKGQV